MNTNRDSTSKKTKWELIPENSQMFIESIIFIRFLQIFNILCLIFFRLRVLIHQSISFYIHTWFYAKIHEHNWNQLKIFGENGVYIRAQG